MKGFTVRTVKIGAVLNSPPLLFMIIVVLNLDIFPVVFLALMWANIPLQYAGMASLFDQSQLQFTEWGMNQATPVVWFSIVFFWLIVSAVLSVSSLLFSRKN